MTARPLLVLLAAEEAAGVRALEAERGRGRRSGSWSFNGPRRHIMKRRVRLLLAIGAVLAARTLGAQETVCPLPPAVPGEPHELCQLNTRPIPDPANPPPDYPLVLLEAGISGTVRLRTVISATGRPMDSATTLLSGSRYLFEASRAALRSWTFTPGLRGGLAVPAILELEIAFELPRRDTTPVRPTLAAESEARGFRLRLRWDPVARDPRPPAYSSRDTLEIARLLFREAGDSQPAADPLCVSLSWDRHSVPISEELLAALGARPNVLAAARCPPHRDPRILKAWVESWTLDYVRITRQIGRGSRGSFQACHLRRSRAGGWRNLWCSSHSYVAHYGESRASAWYTVREP